SGTVGIGGLTSGTRTMLDPAQVTSWLVSGSGTLAWLGAFAANGTAAYTFQVAISPPRSTAAECTTWNQRIARLAVRCLSPADRTPRALCGDAASSSSRGSATGARARRPPGPRGQGL